LPPSKVETGAEGARRQDPEILVRQPADRGEPPSLDPEEQPSAGPRAGGDPAELFSLLSAGPEPTLPLPSAVKAEIPPPGVADLATLVERWVRRVALGGDQRRGVAKLDIGEGRYAGSELVVVADAGRVSVELSLPGAVDPGLAERLQSRLERRGYSAEVTVR